MPKQKLAAVTKTNPTEVFIVKWRKNDEVARLVHGWNLDAKEDMPEVIVTAKRGFLLGYRFDRESPDVITMRRFVPGPGQTVMVMMRRPFHGK